jgi:hypothetical protein
MSLRSSAEEENGRGPGIDCHPERSEGSALCFYPFETDSKQILRRFAPQNDIATSPQGDGRQAYDPNFEGEREGHEEEIEVEIFIPHVFFVLL